MLRAYRAIFMGEPTRETAAWPDPFKALRWPVVLLLAALLIAGFAPGKFLSLVQPGFEAILPK